jgi:hypothetical protein
MRLLRLGWWPSRPKLRFAKEISFKQIEDLLGFKGAHVPSIKRGVEVYTDVFFRGYAA